LKCAICGDRSFRGYAFDHRCMVSSCSKDSPFIDLGDPQINRIITSNTCERCRTASITSPLSQQGSQGYAATSLALPPDPSQLANPRASAGTAPSAPQTSNQCMRCLQIGQACTWSSFPHKNLTAEEPRCDQCAADTTAKCITTYSTSTVPGFREVGGLRQPGRCYYCALDDRQCTFTKDPSGLKCDRCFDHGPSVQLPCTRQWTRVQLEADSSQ